MSIVPGRSSDQSKFWLKSLGQITSRYLDIVHDGETVTISLSERANVLELTLRRKEMRRRMKSALKPLQEQAHIAGPDSLTARWSPQLMAILHGVATTIDKKLDIIANRPLPPRLVEEALNITSKERVRWTKDGRPAKTGGAHSRKAINRFGRSVIQ